MATVSVDVMLGANGLYIIANDYYIFLYSTNIVVNECDLANLLKVDTTADLLKVDTTANLLEIDGTANLLEIDTTANLLKVDTMANLLECK